MKSKSTNKSKILKEVLKEAIREVIREEMRQIIREEIKSNKPVMENNGLKIHRNNWNDFLPSPKTNPIPNEFPNYSIKNNQPVNPLAKFLEQTKNNMDSSEHRDIMNGSTLSTNNGGV